MTSAKTLCSNTEMCCALGFSKVKFLANCSVELQHENPHTVRNTHCFQTTFPTTVWFLVLGLQSVLDDQSSCAADLLWDDRSVLLQMAVLSNFNNQNDNLSTLPTASVVVVKET